MHDFIRIGGKFVELSCNNSILCNIVKRTVPADKFQTFYNRIFRFNGISAMNYFLNSFFAVHNNCDRMVNPAVIRGFRRNSFCGRYSSSNRRRRCCNYRSGRCVSGKSCLCRSGRSCDNRLGSLNGIGAVSYRLVRLLLNRRRRLIVIAVCLFIVCCF